MRIIMFKKKEKIEFNNDELRIAIYSLTDFSKLKNYNLVIYRGEIFMFKKVINGIIIAISVLLIGFVMIFSMLPSPVVLQKILGHKDIQVTLNTYTDVFNEFKEKEIEKIDDFFNK